jgi:phosphoribosylformylglycinamidine synthase
MGFAEVEALRVGKVLELEMAGSSTEAARQRVEEMCSKLLANPVIEDFTVEMVG